MEKKNIFKSKAVIFIYLGLAFIFILLLPMIANELLFSWRASSTNGNGDTWISFFATYYGAIVGGIIAGTLTLIGVRLTIKSSMDGINKTIEEQRAIRQEDLLIQTNRDILEKFYYPMDLLINKFHYKHGVHCFSELSFEEQTYFLERISENLIFADSEINVLVLEMRWAYKDGDYSILDEKYPQVSDLITIEIQLLREKLKMPPLDYVSYMNRD